MHAATAMNTTQRSSAVPTSSPRAMQHWRACQGCETGKSLNKEET